MKKYILIAAFVLIPACTSAHVVVSPKTAPGASYQTFVVSVPSERALATTKVRLLIPEGLTSVRPNVKPGWNIELVKENVGTTTVVKEIVWSGGSIPTEFRDEFSLSGKTMATGTLVWKAYQTYRDGNEVAWDAAPAPGEHNHAAVEGPYSETMITPLTHDHSSSIPSHSGHDLLLPLLALALSILALHEIIRMKKTK